MTPESLASYGYHGVFQRAVKRDYSGTGLYTHHKPDEVIVGFDNGEFGAEGRYTEARYGKLSAVLVYMPSGSGGEERQQAKFHFTDLFMEHLKDLRHEKGREVMLCGDVSTVHKEIDTKNWKGNQKSPGCLSEEYAWLAKFLDEVGCVNMFRTLGQRPGQYMWWSNCGQTYTRSVG